MNKHVLDFMDQREAWMRGVDTHKLQYKSLEHFLAELGYEMANFGGDLHIYKHRVSSQGHYLGRQFLSLKGAVSLHNGKLKMGWFDMYGFTPEDMDNAKEAKLVEKVTLRRNKKYGLEVATNFVKLCCEQYMETEESSSGCLA